MIKKTIKYVDYNGQERKEDFYFNLSKLELLDMETSVQGGLSEYIKKIANAKDTNSLISLFKDLIVKSYGEKSEDGRRFIKSKELTDSFVQTEACSELFMELVNDSDKASKFVNGIVSQGTNE